MRKGRELLQRLTDSAQLAETPLLGLPIIEIAGEQRVLIENHLGVKAYGRDSVLVKVPFGCVRVCGCSLEIQRMTREQLIIQGKIDSVVLLRRG